MADIYLAKDEEGGRGDLAPVISTGAQAKVTPTHQPQYTWDIVGGAWGIRIRVWKGYYPGAILIKMGDGFC